MIVKYFNDGDKVVVEKGRDSDVRIPVNATNVEVRFQVMRFISVWSDVKKWDRIRKQWCLKNEDYQPHIFRYRSPVSRKFTIRGSLYYEGVVKVTDADCQLYWEM
jgi:hypothetical protein